MDRYFNSQFFLLWHANS